MKILLIDDDEVGIKNLAFLLETGRHCCQVFTVPQQAIEAYRPQGFDVVIASVVMLGMDGLSVLQRVRSLNPDPAVIIVVGQIDTDIISILNNRVYAYLGRPLLIEKLMSTIGRSRLENREMEQVGWEHDCLAMEYASLRRAFEDLQDLLKAQ